MPALNAADYPKEFRPDIQALRALAVIAVVLYHGGIPGAHAGFLGVDVFFVVSGFVITNVLLEERAERHRTSITGFYGRRIRRILPAATVILIATIFFTYHYLSFILGADAADDAKWVAAFMGNVHFSSLGSNYFTASYKSTLLQYWSLAVEEQFYLVWPALFLGVASIGVLFRAPNTGAVALSNDSWPVQTRSRLDPIRRWLEIPQVRWSAVLLIIIGGSMAWTVVATNDNPVWAFYSPFSRAWELALGALIAVLGPWLRGRLRWPGLALQVIGTAVIVACIWIFSSQTVWPGTAVFWPVLATGAVIVGGSLRGVEHMGWFAKLWPTQWFGKISYSLYLVHWPILIIAAEYSTTGSVPLHTNLELIGLSVVVAAFLFYVVENPIRRWRWLSRHRIATYAMGVVLIGASYGAIYWHLHNEGSLALGTNHARVMAQSPPAGSTEGG